MRSYLSQAAFFKKMKKRPEVQVVLNNINNYSEEQISQLPSNHFPLWIKEVLTELRIRGGRTAEDVAQDIAAQMISKSNNK